MEELKLALKVDDLDNVATIFVDAITDGTRAVSSTHLDVYKRQQAHRALAAGYTADERFTAYYDRKLAGCAQFLCDAVQYWAR